MSKDNIWKDSVAIEAILEDMARVLREKLHSRNIDDPLMVGIHTGGAWIAEHLHRRLELKSPLCSLDISFYRDDFTRIGFNPVVKPSDLKESVDDRHVILVDDVLYTGRTIRAALNELFDYGRPASVILTVLAERDGRELPITADVTGLHPEPGPDRYIELQGPQPLELIVDRNRPNKGSSKE